MNLVNPVNALAGVDIPSTMKSRGHRHVWLASLKEAHAVYDQAGISPVQPGGHVDAKQKKLGMLLGLPQLVALPVVLLLTAGRGGGKTSMSADMSCGRETEIDYINGHIVALGKQHNGAAAIQPSLPLKVYV